MEVYVIGVAQHRPSRRIASKRLEEMVFDTTYGALQGASVERTEIDHVTIAACDELDGRSISSMLLATPAGAYLKDEIKCTDSGLMGLCLGAMRIEAGAGELGLVVSWNKSSIAPVEDVMRMRAEPFFTRPVGLNMAIADALFAGIVAERSGIREAEVNERVAAAYGRAAANPRGMGHEVPSAANVGASAYLATPLREGQRAPLNDGAVALVLASPRWLDNAPEARPLARLAGLGWSVERYRLGGDRLGALEGHRAALGRALAMAGLAGAGDLDLIELDAQTGYHEAAFARVLEEDFAGRLSPAGGAFAQNPYFCTGLNNAAEAVLQLADRAGPVQVAGARRAAAHGCHGFAQQGNVWAIFERV